MNAVTSGVADVREVLKRARARLDAHGQPTYLLLDECHRWNKAQSDSILPAMENGTIRFIGSTTENPMIAMTPAIVSRCRVFQFVALSEADLLEAMRRALSDEERGFGGLDVELKPDAARHIAFTAGRRCAHGVKCIGIGGVDDGARPQWSNRYRCCRCAGVNTKADDAHGRELFLRYAQCVLQVIARQ